MTRAGADRVPITTEAEKSSSLARAPLPRAGTARIQVIGNLRVTDSHGIDVTPKGRKTRAVLAYLACLAADRTGEVARARVSGLIWDRSAEPQAQMSLRRALADLAEALGPLGTELIRRDGDTLRVDAASCEIDAVVLLGTAPGEPLLQGNDWMRACKSQLLEDHDGVSDAFDEWLLQARSRFAEEIRRLAEARLQRLIADGASPEERAAAALRLIELDPTHELAARARMKAFIELDRRAEALREYERCRDALRRLLDAAPSAETDRLNAAIRTYHGVSHRPEARETVERSRAHSETGALAEERASVASTPGTERPFLPIIGFIPLDARIHDPRLNPLGEIIAEEAVAQLSSSGLMRVISRLSTTALRGQGKRADEIGSLLGSNLVVSGGYQVHDDEVRATLELADARSQEVIWSGVVRGTIADVIAPQSPFVGQICANITNALATRAMRRVHRLPLPTLETFSLQLAASALMHRPTVPEFKRSREILEYLIEQFPRAPEPRAWLAKWHVLQVTRGYEPARNVNADAALAQTSAAIDNSPDCALAMAVEGFIHCHMRRDLDRAAVSLSHALQVNPNEPLAWLVCSVVEAFKGESQSAFASAQRAIQLSPLDPMRHYFDALGSGAALAAGRHVDAIVMATRSLQVNGTHLPTLRGLAIAQVETGAIDAAKQTIARYLKIDPGFTLRAYSAGAPKGGERFRERCVIALRKAGVPEL